MAKLSYAGDAQLLDGILQELCWAGCTVQHQLRSIDQAGAVTATFAVSGDADERRLRCEASPRPPPT